MTWWLWLLLALAALATFVVIGVQLWRAVRRFFAAAAEAGELLQRLAPTEDPPSPALARPVLASPGELGVALNRREANLEARRLRRWRRADAAHERWRRVGLRD